MAQTHKFKLGNATHVIGTKMFPVASKAKCMIFHQGNTSLLDEYHLKAKLDEIQFESGRCYSNADLVTQIGQQLGLPVQFYSGWVFILGAAPLHHAWAMLGQHLIDPSVSIREMDLLNRVDTKDPLWREQVAPILRAYSEQKRPTSIDRVVGQVPEGYVYVGSPDDPQNARRIFVRLMEQFPDHPCYPNHRHDPWGRTKLQAMMGLEPK